MIPASPAAAAADTELHAWLEQIAAKKAELSAATAAAAAASKELAALEAAVKIPHNEINTLLRSLTTETPAEHKQTTSEQEAARPPAPPTATKTLQNIFKSISAGLTDKKTDT